jgi:hypothetical protein
MSKATRLADFQVCAPPAGLDLDVQRRINEALFTVFEPIRLWLKEHVVAAPFRKVIVSLVDAASFAQWHGRVSNVMGVCEVMEAVDVAALRKYTDDHRWVLRIVEHALGCVAENTGWQSKDLGRFAKALSKRKLPLVHIFESLEQLDSNSGVKCVPWLSTRPGETQVGVRIGRRNTVIKSHPGPLYLEDTFPLSNSAIREGEYVLLDKTGKRLASVAINVS